jgi:hypothetical protein
MKCPYCNKQAKVKDYVYKNLESYGGSVRARSACCGKVLWVSIQYVYKAQPAGNRNEKDSWGE